MLAVGSESPDATRERRREAGHVINIGFLIGNHTVRATGITQYLRNGGGRYFYSLPTTGAILVRAMVASP
jgi:hypothetical protein